MYALHCPTCQLTHLMGNRSIVSLHNTSEGPVGLVRCPEGHELLTTFDERRAGIPVSAERTRELSLAAGL